MRISDWSSDVCSSDLLLLCLGPRDLTEDVHDLLAAREAGDIARVQQIARNLQRGPQPDASHRSLMGTLFIQSHEKLFGVLLFFFTFGPAGAVRSEEHTSELQSLMRISYAVFCLIKKSKSYVLFKSTPLT